MSDLVVGTGDSRVFASPPVQSARSNSRIPCSQAPGQVSVRTLLVTLCKIADPDQGIVPPRVSHARSSRGPISDVEQIDMRHGPYDHRR